MTKRGNLFIVSGPTAAGKGTICTKLSARRPDIKLSVSCATREIRKGEIDGVHYFFVTLARFDEMIEHGELLEHANVHGNKYGTPRAFVEEMLNSGNDVILEIDVQGAQQVMEKKLDGINPIPVFVLPPSREVLEQRLRTRATETEEQIQTRLKTAASELLEAKKYKYLIVNEELEPAVKTLEGIIDASHAEAGAHMGLLQSLYNQFQEVN